MMMAAEPDLKKDDKFITHAELGYIETQGNTVTQGFNLDTNVKKGWGKHIFKWSLDGQYASDKNKETKNKFITELEYNYEFTDRLSFSYLVGYKQDKFSGFTYQFYTGPGAKYTAIKTASHSLNIEGNILYSQDDIEDTKYAADGSVIEYPNPDGKTTANIVSGEINDYASFRAKAVYNWQIAKNLKFNQELSYRMDLEGSDTYFIFSKTAFSSKISDMFSAGISYKVDYSNLPANGKEYTDRTFSANLIIDY